jgi:hypothetical protein
MYYTEQDPFTGEKVYVPKDLDEKKMQRALMHFNKPENRETVRKALQKAHREDLIPVLLGSFEKKDRSGSFEKKNRKIRPVEKIKDKAGKRK